MRRSASAGDAAASGTCLATTVGVRRKETAEQNHCEVPHTRGKRPGSIIAAFSNGWRLPCRPRWLRSLPTRSKPATPAVDLLLKIGTALLMTFAATLVLVHAEIYLAQSPTMF